MALIPNPKPAIPPGLGPIADTVVSWGKWAVLAAGVVGLLICAMQIIIGRRNRNAMAADGVAGAVWVIGGLALAASAAGLVGVFIL